MLTADDTIRYAINRDGYYIGQPMTGNGTFSDWSLARVRITRRIFESIEFERTLSDAEVSIVLQQPILYWFVLATPRVGTAHTWAFMQCKYDTYAEANRTIITPKRSVDGGGSLV